MAATEIAGLNLPVIVGVQRRMRTVPVLLRLVRERCPMKAVVRSRVGSIKKVKDARKFVPVAAQQDENSDEALQGRIVKIVDD